VIMHPHHRPVPKWATYATPIAVMAASVLVSVIVVNT
jgi:hypothetical protein